MKSNYLRIVYGTCELRALVFDDAIEVGSLNNPTNKNKGQGRAVLALLKHIADRPIRLHPWAENGDHDRLKAWYERNGFWDTGDWFWFQK